MSGLDVWKIRGGYPYMWHRWPDEKPERNGPYLVQERLDRGAEMYVAEYRGEEEDDWCWILPDGDGVYVAAWMELPRGIYSDEEIETAVREAMERLERLRRERSGGGK